MLHAHHAWPSAGPKGDRGDRGAQQHPDDRRVRPTVSCRACRGERRPICALDAVDDALLRGKSRHEMTTGEWARIAGRADWSRSVEFASLRDFVARPGAPPGMVRDRPARGERRLEMYYAADRRYVLPGQNERASHHQLPRRRRTLDPTFSPHHCFRPSLWKFIPRPQADAHRRIWGDRNTWNPIWTQETRLRAHARRLRREAPENSSRRRADGLARRYGISQAAGHDQRAVCRGRMDHQTVPTDRCWSARRSGAVGTHPTAREFRSSTRAGASDC